MPISKKWKIFIGCTLFVGFLLRFYSVFFLSPPEINLHSDMGNYLLSGDEIFKGIYNLTQNFQPLGFTIFGATLRLIGGWTFFGFVQVLLSWGTSILIFLMARKYLGFMTGIIALIISTLHFPHITFASYYLAECTYTFLITLTMWWILRSLEDEKIWKYFIAGLLFMLSFYFKGTHTLFIPIFSLWLLFRKKNHLKMRLASVAVMAAGCLVIMSAQLMWTSYAYQKAMPGPTAGAINFVEGKCPWKYNSDLDGHSWASPLFVQIGVGGSPKVWPRPFTDQEFYWSVGLECVKENPAVIASSLSYIYYLFLENSLWPQYVNKNFLGLYEVWQPWYLFFLLPASLIGFILLRKEKNDLHRLMTLSMLSVFIMVVIFKSENRFRVPFDFALILWSSYFFEKVAAQIFGLIRKPST